MAAPADPLVLVTGAAGLLGSAISRALAPAHRVVGLDVARPTPDGSGTPCLEADLTDDASLERALSVLGERHGRQLASVIHLAAHYDFSGEDSPLYDELTVEGTRRLLHRLRAGFEVGQFVFASSLLVMEPAREGELLREDAPTRAEWAYPRSKLAAEAVLRDPEVRGDVLVVILRIAGVYDDLGHSIPLAQHIIRIYEKRLESVFFPGNPHHGQAFVHLDDVVDCILRVVHRRDRLEAIETFLVGETDLMSYGELQDRIGALAHGKAWPSLRIPAPVAKAGAWLKDRFDDDSFIKPWMIDQADAHYPVSIERARRRLGWIPRHRLRERLAAIVGALHDDPERWYAAHGLAPSASGLR